VKSTENLENLDKKIAEMEGELDTEHGRALTWEEVTKASQESLIERQQRLSFLPQALAAAKTRRLELLKERQQTELDFRKKEAAEATDALTEAQDAVREAEERLEEVRGQRSAAVSAVIRLEQDVRQTTKKLSEQKEVA
jgi:beta-phosphoglucomutase-like phosphatase (HAD superfamily)